VYHAPISVYLAVRVPASCPGIGCRERSSERCHRSGGARLGIARLRRDIPAPEYGCIDIDIDIHIDIDID
jgi:hypothetical protein